MTMLKEGRPTAPTPVEDAQMAPATATGNRALMLEEKLIFEIGSTATTGVDFADAPQAARRLGSLARTDGIGLHGLSERLRQVEHRALLDSLDDCSGTHPTADTERSEGGA